jgi:phage baseplate assembly protein V
MSAPMSQRYRAHSFDRRLYGVFAGLIDDNQDPEHEGRVKVRFPWLDDATVSEWCRVVQPYAGDGYGATFVPELGTEVLVAFVHGDMNEPVVIGGVYNGKDKPPAYRDGTRQDVKMLKTKAGHVVRLDDSAEARAIEIKTAGGHTLRLDDQEKKITITSTGGHTLVLDDRGNKLELAAAGGTGKLTIEASGKITLQGTIVTVSAQQVSLGG